MKSFERAEDSISARKREGMCFKKLWKKIIYGRASSPSTLEQEIFKYASKALSSSQSTQLERQIQNIFLIQRDHKNKISRYSLEKKSQFRFESLDQEVSELCRVKYRVAGKTKESGIYLHEGFLSSFETRGGLTNDDLGVIPEDVQIVISKDSNDTEKLSSEIDFEEHMIVED